MSVVMKTVVALKHVITMMEASLVHVTMVIYRMELIVMVWIQTCAYMTGSVKTSLTFQPFLQEVKFSVAFPNTKFSLVPVQNHQSKCSNVSVSSKLS